MTLKELKKWKCRAEKCVEIYKNNGKDTSTAKVTIPADKFLNLTDTAIKALEQQTCEDAVSRHDALNCITGNEVRYRMVNDIRALPSVTPKEKTGHWIFDEILDRHYYCSECKSMGVDYWDYCPNCGCHMVEPQESGDKE